MRWRWLYADGARRREVGVPTDRTKNSGRDAQGRGLLWAFPAFDGRKSCITKGGTPIGYRNAEEVLPKELLVQIRKYIEGEAIYIPKAAEKRTSWGGKTGTRAEYDKRNRAIAEDYRNGCSVNDLAGKYCLCADSIRKILRNREEETT